MEHIDHHGEQTILSMVLRFTIHFTIAFIGTLVLEGIIAMLVNMVQPW